MLKLNDKPVISVLFDISIWVKDINGLPILFEIAID